MEKSPITLKDIQDVEEMFECGMQDEAEAKIVALAQAIEHDVVYEQVGALTRDLHDTIDNFANDVRLRQIAQVEIPNASERLSSIISMTESAANKTLDAVDACEPMVTSLLSTIENLLPAWDQLMHGHIDRFEFVTLVHKIDDLINKTRDNALAVSDQLNNIMMAQDYQDLTGQMIQKVIKLVSEVEAKLVKFLVKFNGDKELPNVSAAQNHNDNGIQPQGPMTEAEKQTENVAASQDDVDDLLANLGF